MAAGRPREFDYDVALDEAIRVFWSKGFEGASMPDLTEAMGMNRPSIYSAFGNKEELFRKALERYSQKAITKFREVLDKPTIKESIESFMCATATSLSCCETPRGCLTVQSALVGSDECENARQEALARREDTVDVLKERFERALKDGEIPKGTDIAGLARFFVATTQGMSVQSAGGASCDDLRAIAYNALKALDFCKSA